MSVKEQEKNKIKQTRNRKYKTLIKNRLKKIDACLKGDEKNDNELKKMVSEAQKFLDKASRKKIIHKNKASNKKAKYMKKTDWGKKKI